MIARALQRALGVLTDLNEERALAAIYALRPELERVSGDYGFMLSAVGCVRVAPARMAQLDGAARQFARMAAGALQLMDGWDGYVTGAGQAQLYDWLMRNEPELFERMRERVSQGRWEIQGALWAEPDMRMTGGEAIVRQILYGKRFYARNFALDVNAVWLLNSPGCCAQLPQLMRRSGIQYILCGRAGAAGALGVPAYELLATGPGRLARAGACAGDGRAATCCRATCALRSAGVASWG